MKNYIGNKDILQRLKLYGNEATLRELLIQANEDHNLRTIKRSRLGDKYNVVVNRSLLS